MARQADRILDEFLAASARAGDPAAFEALSRRWAPRLLSHAWRLTGEAELARDTAQDAWSDIVANIRRLDDTAAFPAWAFRIVTRRAADAIRKRQRGRAGLAAYAAERSGDHVGASDIEARASSASIGAALAALPAGQRAAIALFYLEDMSVAEIASALDVPAGTVKTRLMAAREKLKAALGVTTETENEQA
ncbi:MAG: sigma-70 family RNA polymerase sigma factor [Parvularculaceae bacterium]